MTLTLLFFASVKESLDRERETFDTTEISTVEDLILQLVQRGPQWQRTLQAQKILVAVNQTISQLSTPLHSGDEVAFFPPVTGG